MEYVKLQSALPHASKMLTPVQVAKIAQLVHEAGFPPGVLNIIHGFGKPAGSTLALHNDVRLINFTGSSATGKLIQEMSAKSNLKKVILEYVPSYRRTAWRLTSLV